MPKQSGIPSRIQIEDSGGVSRDISNDITNFTLGTPRGVQDITGLDKSAMERLLLLADGTFTVNGVFNPTANRAHDVFKTVPSTSVIRTVIINPSGIGGGAPQLTMEMLFSTYNLTRAQDGSLTYEATGQLADGAVPTWSTI